MQTGLSSVVSRRWKSELFMARNVRGAFRLQTNADGQAGESGICRWVVVCGLCCGCLWMGLRANLEVSGRPVMFLQSPGQTQA